MRVMVFCEFASLNGGERSLLEVARRLAASDAELVIAAPGSGPLAETLRDAQLQHDPFEPHNAQGARLGVEQLRGKIAESIARIRPAVVHANSVSMSRLLGPVAVARNVPSVGHLRDIMRLSHAAIADLNRHDRLLAVSQATRQWYVDAGVAACRAEVLHNGVDVTRFQPRPPRGQIHQQLGLPADTLLVGTVGQLGMRKGLDLFVEAAARMARRRTDIHFLHIGQRYSQKPEAVAYEESVRCVADAPPLSGRFHFLGVREDVEHVLNELTVYVHAARQEPLGRVLLEAGAAGTAIVATDVGGTREIFPIPAEAALVVPPQSVTHLEGALERLLADADLRQRLGRHARQRILMAFEADAAAARLLEVYRSLAPSTNRTLPS